MLPIAILHTFALFWPALETIRLWLVATSTPKPIKDIEIEETEEGNKE